MSAGARAKLVKREKQLLGQLRQAGTDGQTTLHGLFVEYANPSTDPNVRNELYYFVFGHFGVPRPEELDAAREGEAGPEVYFREFKHLVLSKWATTNHQLWVHCLVWGLYGNQNTLLRVNNALNRLCFAKLEDAADAQRTVRRKRRYRDAGNGYVYNEDGTTRKKRIFRCSLCGSTEHNKRRCPRATGIAAPRRTAHITLSHTHPRAQRAPAGVTASVATLPVAAAAAAAAAAAGSAAAGRVPPPAVASRPAVAAMPAPDDMQQHRYD